MRSRKTIQMAEIALMSAVLCIIAPFTVPVPASPVPLSLALLGVYLAAVLLGAKQGTVCVFIYLLLGMVGLPVFSGFSGGIGVLLGPTGGYIIGYVLCAVIVGIMTHTETLGKSLGKWRFFLCVVAMTSGTLACYLVGTIWFIIIMQGAFSLTQALLVCVVPYLLFDIIKILVAAAIAIPVRNILQRIEQQ